MIVPDTNLLLYAHDELSPDHSKARAWWSCCLGGEEQIRLPTIVIFGFIRISTNPRLFVTPFSPAQAVAAVRAWLIHPVVSIVEESYRDRVFSLIEAVGAKGNLVSDAQVAAVAIEENATLHTADVDFHRFPNLRVLNPLTAGR
jgi:toxin-antitoxin system PIN domain toxin